MSHVSAFDSDPFFADVQLPQTLPLEHHRSKSDRQLTARRQMNHQNVDPVALMQNVMNSMGKMISQMNNPQHANEQPGRTVSYSSSTIISMNRRNGGKPRIFQAASETLSGPEGRIGSIDERKSIVWI